MSIFYHLLISLDYIWHLGKTIPVIKIFINSILYIILHVLVSARLHGASAADCAWINDNGCCRYLSHKMGTGPIAKFKFNSLQRKPLPTNNLESTVPYLYWVDVDVILPSIYIFGLFFYL